MNNLTNNGGGHPASAADVAQNENENHLIGNILAEEEEEDYNSGKSTPHRICY